jgi:hypothetical protein
MEDSALIKTLESLGSLLKDLLWVVFSGTAVRIYSENNREVNDIDVLLPNWEDFVEASERFGVEFRKIVLDKENFTVEDYGFETSLNGVSLDVHAGSPKMTFKGFVSSPKTDQEWVEHVREKEFFGLKVKLQPLEDLMVQKIVMGREKDKKDLESLIKLRDIDIDFIKKVAAYWNSSEKVDSFLRSHDYLL